MDERERADAVKDLDTLATGMMADITQSARLAWEAKQRGDELEAVSQWERFVAALEQLDRITSIQRRLKEDPQAAPGASLTETPGVRALPRVAIKGKEYFVDDRLAEFRAVDNPSDRIPFDSIDPDSTKYLRETSEGTRARQMLIDTIIEEAGGKKLPPVPAERGMLRCRWCGAPYAYQENLELHERGCPYRDKIGLKRQIQDIIDQYAPEVKVTKIEDNTVWLSHPVYYKVQEKYLDKIRSLMDAAYGKGNWSLEFEKE